MNDKMLEAIKVETDAHGELLPPWEKHPEIERYSIGWRMGYGESYMDLWWEWASLMTQAQLVDYFKRRLPLPNEWLDWVAESLGFENALVDQVMESVRWLETLGLADYAAFKTWSDAEYGSGNGDQ